MIGDDLPVDIIGAKKKGIYNKIDIKCGNLLDSQIKNDSVDHIILIESLIHIAEKEKLFEKCFEVLRPSGTIFILISNIRNIALLDLSTSLDLTFQTSHVTKGKEI